MSLHANSIVRPCLAMPSQDRSAPWPAIFQERSHLHGGGQTQTTRRRASQRPGSRPPRKWVPNARQTSALHVSVLPSLGAQHHRRANGRCTGKCKPTGRRLCSKPAKDGKQRMQTGSCSKHPSDLLWEPRGACMQSCTCRVLPCPVEARKAVITVGPVPHPHLGHRLRQHRGVDKGGHLGSGPEARLLRPSATWLFGKVLRHPPPVATLLDGGINLFHVGWRPAAMPRLVSRLRFKV